MTTNILSFIHKTQWTDLPPEVQRQSVLNVLDLLGVAAVGSQTRLSQIIRDHAVAQFGGALAVNMMFDGRSTSPAGAALAGGMTIDSIDCHDGYNPVKGHIGCGLLPGILAGAQAAGVTEGRDLLTAVSVGYELAGRLGKALHGTVPDYHTSGAWIAVAVAGVWARLLRLDDTRTRHAMGIAEYHGPRSQMMRCIDHPTMLKDGSGWGAMAGVSAAFLAQSGFTGAPAITAEGDEAAPFWADLGEHWISTDQYYKPYPVCRWAQSAIRGVLDLKQAHNLQSDQVDHIEVNSFDETIRLATKSPENTEQAQYSTSYPCAAAMVRGEVGLAEISPAAFGDPEIQRLSRSLVMSPDGYCNENFPQRRFAKTTLHLKDGRSVSSGYLEPKWSPSTPPSDAELQAKFHALSDPVLGVDRAGRIESAVRSLSDGGSLRVLEAEIYAPII